MPVTVATTLVLPAHLGQNIRLPCIEISGMIHNLVNEIEKSDVLQDYFIFKSELDRCCFTVWMRVCVVKKLEIV